VDYEEFTSLIKSMPAMQHLSQYQICNMYNSATEDTEMTEAVFIALAQGEMKNQLGRDVLDNIANMDADEASYLGILSGHVKKLFDEFDPEETGEIKTETFGDLISKVQDNKDVMSAEESKRVVKLIDVDNSGSISFSEFLDWWRDYALNQAFIKFDKDGSGELNDEELKGLLGSLGIKVDDDKMHDILMNIDLNQDGNVSFAELVQWFAVFDARKAFDQYDADHSGEIGTEELNLLLIDLGANVAPDVLKQALDKLDKDGTGSLSFEEFLPWWNQMQKQKRKDKVGEVLDKPGDSHLMRRRSDQMALLNNNQAYLKMSALRASLQREEENRTRTMLAKIAKDYKLDFKELMDEHLKSDKEDDAK